MFSSKNKASTPIPQMLQEPAKRNGRSSVPSIISADLLINGTLISTGDIQIDGRVEGDVHSASLVIGDKALVHGEILAEDVIVRGTVQGGIRARKVQLAATCRVEGNILHEAFTVEQGAFFEGNCRHSDDPLSEEVKNSLVFKGKTTVAKTGDIAPPRPAAIAPAAIAAVPAKAADMVPPRAVTLGPMLAATPMKSDA
ncbi:MAG: polymer-forming cytoskeletal protein [Rhizomicrobium sp.]